MSLAKRKDLYKEFTAKRGNPVVAYITSGRPGANGNIAQDSIRQFIDQIEKMPQNTKNIDLIINSYGGDGLTSWRLITML